MKIDEWAVKYRENGHIVYVVNNGLALVIDRPTGSTYTIDDMGRVLTPEMWRRKIKSIDKLHKANELVERGQL